jgi:hypothetical protein
LTELLFSQIFKNSEHFWPIVNKFEKKANISN